MTNAETIRHVDGRVGVENGEHKGKAGDGQFLKRGTCVVFDLGNVGRNSCNIRAMILRSTLCVQTRAFLICCGALVCRTEPLKR